MAMGSLDIKTTNKMTHNAERKERKENPILKQKIVIFKTDSPSEEDRVY